MLIKCPECGQRVSNTASACIHCGYVLQKTNDVPVTNDDINEPLSYEKMDNKAKREFEKSVDRHYVFLYIIAFSIPFIAFISGIVFLSKKDDEHRLVGNNCLGLGVISTITFFCLWYMIYKL